MLSNTLPAKRVTWLLSGQLADDQPVRHVRVGASRFTVGRKPDASLSIPSPTVSREHAELTVVDRGMLLRDFGSTNGTFVNGVRIQQPCTVHHGDLLQFGQIVFRAVQQCDRKRSADDSRRFLRSGPGADSIRSVDESTGCLAAFSADCRDE